MSNQSDPAIDGVAVTTSDTVAIAYPQSNVGRGLYIGVGGNVVVVPYRTGATVLTFLNVPSGTILPIAALRVNATSTTATNIIALF